MATMSDQEILDRAERAARSVVVPDGRFEDLLRRRDRKRRNQRIGAGALAIIIALVSFVALTRAFNTERPADEPVPKPPGIFSGVGGWIVYGDGDGIWAVDPSHPSDQSGQIQLSTEEGIPLAWSSDGSNLLISRGSRLAFSGGQMHWEESDASRRGLFVLNADGTGTRLVPDVVSGASFSPDGTTVVFAPALFLPAYLDPGSIALDPGIYLIEADGGVPRLLLAPSRRYSPEQDISLRTELSLPTFSPDGTQIAYIDGYGDWGNSLRVMNADGSDVHVLDGTDLHLLLGGARSLGGHTTGLSWSPDGTHLAVGLRMREPGPNGIFIAAADGSGLTQTIPHGENPYWSPDGSRISFDHGLGRGSDGLQIAEPDGKHVQSFGYAASGPWNPLVAGQEVAEVPAAREVAEVPAASEGLMLTWRLLAVAVLLAVVAGAALIRRRRQRRDRDLSAQHRGVR